jgi:hypothetical protein
MTATKLLPKGFLTKGGLPTQNALTMYLIYLQNLPEGWNIEKLNYFAVKKVRQHFKWNEKTGFDVMIIWGIQQSCRNSTTSCGRHYALKEAYETALRIQRFVWTNKTIKP